MPHDDGTNEFVPTTNANYDEDTPPLIRRTSDVQVNDGSENELILNRESNFAGSTDSNKSWLGRGLIFSAIAVIAVGACYLTYSKIVLENRIVLPASGTQTSSPQASPNQAQASQAEESIDEPSLASALEDESTIASITPAENFEEIIAPFEDPSTIEIIDETSELNTNIMEAQVQTRQAPSNALTQPLFGNTNASRVNATQATPNPIAQSLYRRAYNMRHRDKSQAITYLQQALENSNTEQLTSKIKSLLNKTTYELERANEQ